MGQEVTYVIMYEISNSSLSQVELLDEERIIKEIEEIINQFQLEITQKSTLSTLKGCIHYHLKLGENSGVLELRYIKIDEQSGIKQ
jgi:predicted ATP-grasp superfamily ATP-dependent carboligase